MDTNQMFESPLLVVQTCSLLAERVSHIRRVPIWSAGQVNGVSEHKEKLPLEERRWTGYRKRGLPVRRTAVVDRSCATAVVQFRGERRAFPIEMRERAVNQVKDA